MMKRFADSPMTAATRVSSCERAMALVIRALPDRSERLPPAINPRQRRGFRFHLVGEDASLRRREQPVRRNRPLPLHVFSHRDRIARHGQPLLIKGLRHERRPAQKQQVAVRVLGI